LLKGDISSSVGKRTGVTTMSTPGNKNVLGKEKKE